MRPALPLASSLLAALAVCLGLCASGYAAPVAAAPAEAPLTSRTVLGQLPGLIIALAGFYLAHRAKIRRLVAEVGIVRDLAGSLRRDLIDLRRDLRDGVASPAGPRASGSRPPDGSPPDRTMVASRGVVEATRRLVEAVDPIPFVRPAVGPDAPHAPRE